MNIEVPTSNSFVLPPFNTTIVGMLANCPLGKFIKPLTSKRWHPQGTTIQGTNAGIPEPFSSSAFQDVHRNIC